MQIFISYASENLSFAYNLKKKIQAWGHTAFLDKDPDSGIPEGVSWPDHLAEAIKGCDALFALMSPAATRSQWVKKEIHFAHSCKKPILPLKIQDIEPETQIFGICDIQAVDFTKPADIEAAWARIHNWLTKPRMIFDVAPTQGLNYPIASVKSSDKSNRQRLIDKVRSNWIYGVLNKTLLDEDAIPLEMQLSPPLMLDIKYVLDSTSVKANLLVNADTKLIDVYLSSPQFQLLILGDKASGKTITLLEICRDLLDMAEEGSDKSVPVIFNLSAWSGTFVDFYEWLIEELRIKYQVPPRLGKFWIKEKKIIPLLDGFDEISPDNRDICAASINKFLKRNSPVPLIVCSRLADYSVLELKLEIERTLIIQPLTDEQIRSYLENPNFKETRKLVDDYETVRSLVSSPFILNLMATTYSKFPYASLLLRDGRQEARLRHLFDFHIDMQYKLSDKRYPIYEFRKYLSWLANYMENSGIDTIFHIEAFQPSLFKRKRDYFLYVIISSLIVSTIGAGLISAAVALFFSRIVGADHAFNIFLMVGLANFILILIAFVFTRGAVAGIAIGLAFGLSATIANLSIIGLEQSLLTGLTIGCFSILILAGLFWKSWVFDRDRIKIFDALKWSWKRLSIGLLIIPVTLIAGYLYGVTNTLSRVESRPIEEALVFGLVGGVALSLVNGIFGTGLDARSIPNQGIISSLRQALVVGFIASIIVGFGLGVYFAIAFSPYEGMLVGLGGVMLGVVGMFFGGLTVIQHFSLRLVLRYNHYTPWNLNDFLQYCTELQLMRRVGGGFMFRHRMIQDHFAALYHEFYDD